MCIAHHPHVHHRQHDVGFLANNCGPSTTLIKFSVFLIFHILVDCHCIKKGWVVCGDKSSIVSPLLLYNLETGYKADRTHIVQDTMAIRRTWKERRPGKNSAGMIHSTLYKTQGARDVGIVATADCRANNSLFCIVSAIKATRSPTSPSTGLALSCR